MNSIFLLVQCCEDFLGRTPTQQEIVALIDAIKLAKCFDFRVIADALRTFHRIPTAEELLQLKGKGNNALA